MRTGGGAAAARLIASGRVDRVCWIVPRESLRLQAEEAFADPAWRGAIGHAIAVRAADNGADLCRGLNGYVTTYQAIAAAPDRHLAEVRRHRYLIVVDELHHLPALSDLDPFTAEAADTAWSRAVAPLLESAACRLLMSGTLQRADGRAILRLPYRRPRGFRRVREIDFAAPGWAVVGYSRRQALAERALIPVTFGAVDGEAEWIGGARTRHVASLAAARRLARDALFTALRTEYADAMLRLAFTDCRRHRAERRRDLGLGPAESAPGLGKLLVVAPDQAAAWRYAARLQAWAGGRDIVRVAVSGAPDPHGTIAEFRLRPDPAVLVTVGMAYEGMDCPEVTHVACLTHIRARGWLEQMVARATRVDPLGGAYERQRAVVYHPDDPMFRAFRAAIETEQGGRADLPAEPAEVGEGGIAGGEGDPAVVATGMEDAADAAAAACDALPDAVTERVGRTPIVPLRSSATAVRFETLAPGPDLGVADGAAGRAGGATPSTLERQRRDRIGQMVAGQVVEDEDAGIGAARRGLGYHAYNAALRRVLGKSRAVMTLEELEAAVGWLERNRLSEHLHRIAGDPQYRWSRRQRRRA
ncbi:DEAD/DEAH box helicase [Azospirillum soli]|uniref:DEAD/DEAH box helicase n=1 Tax=Azospirillum soli TaxID=1304799 RepID=UPI001AE6BC27|nr:DEAD/DEAH box helicase family protein [Azospirillum soli]MBP2316049.1 hypothetical protein [Azospirillum soli]